MVSDLKRGLFRLWIVCGITALLVFGVPSLVDFVSGGFTLKQLGSEATGELLASIVVLIIAAIMGRALIWAFSGFGEADVYKKWTLAAIVVVTFMCLVLPRTPFPGKYKVVSCTRLTRHPEELR